MRNIVCKGVNLQWEYAIVVFDVQMHSIEDKVGKFNIVWGMDKAGRLLIIREDNGSRSLLTTFSDRLKVKELLKKMIEKRSYRTIINYEWAPEEVASGYAIMHHPPVEEHTLLTDENQEQMKNMLSYLEGLK
jgi:hypothetical protein